MRLRAVIVFVALAVSAAPVRAQEPATRADALAAERQAKSQQLMPYESTALENGLLRLESGRFIERLLNPPVGFYPKLGNVTAGSGFAMGPGYRRPELLGGHADFQAFAAASFSKYWMIDARLTMPRLAREKLFFDVHAQRYGFPSEVFFGLGPDSRREDSVSYSLNGSAFGTGGGVRAKPWLILSGGIDYLTPRVTRPESERFIADVFDGVEIPGLTEHADLVRYQASFDLNYRVPRGNPRRGGRYLVTYQKFDDQDLDRFDFDRVEVDLQQYLPIVRDRRVIALRAVASMSDGDEVPFYLQRTLGGPDDLRGFRRYRFRDRNMLLLQAEYRWEIFTAVDGAIFYDAGKVAPQLEDLNFDDLESDYGIGFRFGTINGIFLRVEGAFGSQDGKHFILRYGHVF